MQFETFSLPQGLSPRDAQFERATPGRVAFLLDHGGPSLLGYGVACSAAWHSRRPCLLLVVGNGPVCEDLTRLAEKAELPLDRSHLPAARAHRATVRLVHPTGAFSPSMLSATVAELSRSYALTLVQLPPDWPEVPPARRTLRLGPLQGTDPVPAEEYHLCGWSGANVQIRPDRDRQVQVPALTPADEAGLAQGRLAPQSPAGKALGWVARDLLGLKIGVAFGSGGQRGYAHFGIQFALQEAGIPVDYVAGTSIGATSAAALAAGFDHEHALTLMDQAGRATFKPTWPLNSMLSFRKLERLFEQILGSTEFEGLDLPLSVVAADLVSFQEVHFRSGLLRPALLASIAIPGLYPAQRIGQYTLVDGSMISPVPVSAARGLGADLVIGIRLGKAPQSQPSVARSEKSHGSHPGMAYVLAKSVEMMRARMTEHAAQQSDLMIEVPFKATMRLGLRDFTAGRAYVELGETAVRDALPELSRLLPWLQAA